MNSRVRTFLTLISPSWLSAGICLVVAVTVIGVAGWSYVSHNQLFYDYLFGRFGLATALLSAPESFQALRNNIFGSPLTYYAVLLIVAAAIGLLVYELLQGVGRMAREAEVLVEDLRNNKGSSELRQALSRLGVRVAVLAAWAVYWVIFVSAAMPFVISLCEVGLSELGTVGMGGWMPIVAATLLLIFALHMHVIFARLATLRIRLLSR